MELITLNNSQFEFDLTVVDDAGAHGLDYGRIGRLALSTSVSGCSAFLDFTYVENSESTVLGRVSPNGRTSLLMRFGIGGDETARWSMAFILDYVKPTAGEASTQTYSVRGILADYQTLLSRIPYSAESEDPLKTMQVLFSRAGMDVDFSPCPSSSGVRLPFITCAGDSLIDSVEVLLDRASSGRSVLFMAYWPSLGRYRVCNVGAAMKGDGRIAVRNFPSSQMFFENNVTSFTGLRFRDGDSLPLHFRSYADVVNHSFSPKARRWTSDLLGGVEAVRNGLVMDGSKFSQLPVEQDRQKNLGFYFRELQSTDPEGEAGRIVRYVASMFDHVDATVQGTFDLEAGDVVSTPEPEGLKTRLGGLWMACSLTHWFIKESWSTTVTLSRLLVPKE